MSDRVLQHVLADLRPLFVWLQVDELSVFQTNFPGLFRSFKQKETHILDLELHLERMELSKFTGVVCTSVLTHRSVDRPSF